MAASSLGNEPRVFRILRNDIDHRRPLPEFVLSAAGGFARIADNTWLELVNRDEEPERVERAIVSDDVHLSLAGR